MPVGSDTCVAVALSNEYRFVRFTYEQTDPRTVDMPDHAWIGVSDAEKIPGTCLATTAQCMKKQRLCALEHAFLTRYPDEFSNKELVARGKNIRYNPAS